MAVNTNMRVLIVDDFSTMRRIIKNILRQLGFSNITEADDGTSAWEILTKDQIYRYVWNDDFVDDNTIMVHIRRLRMKIEDSPGHPVYLKNIRGMGYQFVAEEVEGRSAMVG